MAKSKKKAISPNDLEEVLMEFLAEAVDTATDFALNYLCKYIQKNWYNKYDPTSYKRTYDFLASATKTDVSITPKNEVVTLIYFDINKIIPELRKNKLSAHAGFNGQSFAEMLPSVIERGGHFYGRGTAKGLGSIEATISMLEKDFPVRVKKELEKKGLKVNII